MVLLYCTTLLQTLVAERIVERYPDEQYYLYFGSPRENNERYRLYYDRLRARCRYSVFEEEREVVYGLKGTLQRWGRLLYLAGHLRLLGVHRVYVASIDDVRVQILMGLLPRSIEFQTFDDGTLNLNPEAWEHFFALEGWPFSIPRLIRHYFPTGRELYHRSQMHYTIFRAKNVFCNTQYLSLFENAGKMSDLSVGGGNDKVVNIFVGQHVYDPYHLEQGRRLINALVQHFHIDSYLPHPKELYIVEAPYVNTSLIAEDYVLGLLRSDPLLKINLYSFCSTALLTLNGVAGINVVSIKPRGAASMHDSTYAIIEQMGITILPWEEEYES